MNFTNDLEQRLAGKEGEALRADLLKRLAQLQERAGIARRGLLSKAEFELASAALEAAQAARQVVELRN